MTLMNVFRGSGSNVGQVLSATALAVTTTVSPSPARSERLEQHLQEPLASRAHTTPTDSDFIVGDRLTSLFASNSGLAFYDQAPISFTKLAVTPVGPFKLDSSGNTNIRTPSVSPPVLNADLAIQAATVFYETLSEDVKSPVLWDIVTIAHILRVPMPTIDHIDGMTTADFSGPGKLLSFMVEPEVFHLSAFSRRKELKLVYLLEPNAPKDEMLEILWAHIQDFQRTAEA